MTDETRIQTEIARHADRREAEAVPGERPTPAGDIFSIREEHSDLVGCDIVVTLAKCRDRRADPLSF